MHRQIEHNLVHAESPNWSELVSKRKRQQGLSDNQKAIDSILNTTMAAVRLLLPDISSSRILYIGCDTSDTASNLSEHCKSLSAIFTSADSYDIQQQKAAIRGNKHSYDIKPLHHPTLPFPDDSFDGVFIDEALENLELLIANSTPKHADPRHAQASLMNEIHRITKPYGWIFIKGRNRYSRETLFFWIRRACHSLTRRNRHASHIRPKAAQKTPNISKLLTGIGFSIQNHFGFDQPDLSTCEITDLTNKTKTSNSTISKKYNLIPTWLYRLSIPSIGILATKNTLFTSVIQDIVKKVSDDVYPDAGCTVVSMITNQKGKFVATLENKNGTKRKSVLKIPLTSSAQKHMNHHFRGLTLINNQRERISPTHNGASIFPKPILHGYCASTPFYLESWVLGRPLKKAISHTQPHLLIQRVEDALANLQCASQDPEVLTSQQNQIATLRAFIIQHNPAVLPQFIKISEQLMQEHAIAKGKRYFYKSDFTVSNVLIDKAQRIGVIDLDFWGVSHNKLIDYADFILSFLRTHNGFSYSHSLRHTITQDELDFGPYFNIKQTVAALGGNEQELKAAFKWAWINSVCHLLEFERNKLSQDKLDYILYSPIKALTEEHSEH